MPAYAYVIDDDDIPPYAPQGTVATPAGASHVGAWFLNPVTPALDANQQALQDQEIAEVTTFARTGNPLGEGQPGVARVRRLEVRDGARPGWRQPDDAHLADLRYPQLRVLGLDRPDVVTGYWEGVGRVRSAHAQPITRELGFAG